MFKEVIGKPINKKFDDGIKIFSGLKDYFGNRCYILVNEDLKELRVVAKDPEYKRKRKSLDSKGLPHVIIQEFGIVIDFTREAAKAIEHEFPEYKHTEFSIW